MEHLLKDPSPLGPVETVVEVIKWPGGAMSQTKFASAHGDILPAVGGLGPRGLGSTVGPSLRRVICTLVTKDLSVMWKKTKAHTRTIELFKTTMGNLERKQMS